MRSTLLLLRALQKWQLGFFGLFVSFSKALPRLRMRAVIFSPIQFLCVLLLEERCVQVQALQHCSKGSHVAACVARAGYF